ncbi:tyrosine-type recombinase/integrase [Paraflavitalea speifideaquila]|uniref:tyrosine-type recombinase/integrase n=1 Tax=Paraflavitalea speifideaquila TaxID=3076558 RepID=UPI0028EB5E18|nr:phage integrase N-terminal SAM-like domain-containing protein [Paraflavitalea speifideiaquila]
MVKNISKISFEPGTHKEKDVIWIRFDYDKALISEVRALTASAWSQSKQCWYVYDTNAYRKMFGMEPVPARKETILQVHPVNQPAFIKLRETLELKMYSHSTIKTYTIEFAQLLYILKSYPVDELSPQRLRSCFLYCVHEVKLSENTWHSHLNAVKFYFEQVLGREKFCTDIPRPKKPSLLPRLVSEKEITKILEHTVHPRHNLMLRLCYGMGLRVSEIVNIRIRDIDSQAMQVLIAGAKGKKTVM